MIKNSVTSSSSSGGGSKGVSSSSASSSSPQTLECNFCIHNVSNVPFKSGLFYCNYKVRSGKSSSSTNDTLLSNSGTGIISNSSVQGGGGAASTSSFSSDVNGSTGNYGGSRFSAFLSLNQVVGTTDRVNVSASEHLVEFERRFTFTIREDVPRQPVMISRNATGNSNNSNTTAKNSSPPSSIANLFRRIKSSKQEDGGGDGNSSSSRVSTSATNHTQIVIITFKQQLPNGGTERLGKVIIPIRAISNRLHEKVTEKLLFQESRMNCRLLVSWFFVPVNSNSNSSTNKGSIYQHYNTSSVLNSEASLLMNSATISSATLPANFPNSNPSSSALFMRRAQYTDEDGTTSIFSMDPQPPPLLNGSGGASVSINSARIRSYANSNANANNSNTGSIGTSNFGEAKSLLSLFSGHEKSTGRGAVTKSRSNTGAPPPPPNSSSMKSSDDHHLKGSSFDDGELEADDAEEDNNFDEDDDDDPWGIELELDAANSTIVDNVFRMVLDRASSDMPK